MRTKRLVTMRRGRLQHKHFLSNEQLQNFQPVKTTHWPPSVLTNQLTAC